MLPKCLVWSDKPIEEVLTPQPQTNPFPQQRHEAELQCSGSPQTNITSRPLLFGTVLFIVMVFGCVSKW